MESIIKDEVVKVLEEKQRLTRHQHGFTKGRSCLTNLLETLEAWTGCWRMDMELMLFS